MEHNYVDEWMCGLLPIYNKTRRHQNDKGWETRIHHVYAMEAANTAGIIWNIVSTFWETWKRERQDGAAWEKLNNQVSSVVWLWPPQRQQWHDYADFHWLTSVPTDKNRAYQHNESKYAKKH